MRANVEVTMLLEEKGRLQREIARIDGEIYKIRLACKHDGEIEYSARILDRWLYPHLYENFSDNRVIEKRYCKCTICGADWDEMRFTDGEWMSLNMWPGKHLKVADI